MDYRSRLALVAKTYADATELSVARVATLACKDGKFFTRLQKGGGCTVDTYEATLQWFSNRWPEKTTWPKGVMRPTPAEQVGA